MNTQHDVFYNYILNRFPIEEQKDFFRKAYSMCDVWYCDVLDCSKSFARQRVKGISFEETLEKYTSGMGFAAERKMLQDKPYLETGFRDFKSPEHFLFIHVKTDYKDLIKELEENEK